MPMMDGLARLKALQAQLGRYEGSKSLRGRVGGCLGSYHKLRPGTLDRVLRDCERFLASNPKPVEQPPEQPPYREVKEQRWRQWPWRTPRAYGLLSNRRTPRKGMEIWEHDAERLESLDLRVERICRNTAEDIEVLLDDGERLCIPRLEIMEIARRPDGCLDVTVPVQWAQTMPLPEYL